jgi:hypothetical protein
LRPSVSKKNVWLGEKTNLEQAGIANLYGVDI